MIVFSMFVSSFFFPLVIVHSYKFLHVYTIDYNKRLFPSLSTFFRSEINTITAKYERDVSSDYVVNAI